MGHRVELQEVSGDILAMRAGALVNPWNRNFIPLWLRHAGGLSGKLKKLTGPQPWRDLARMGTLELGQAVATGPGAFDLVDELIHVAGLTRTWRATPESVRLSTQNAVALARQHGHTTITMPLIGSGLGGLTAEDSRTAITGALAALPPHECPLRVALVEYQPSSRNGRTA